jgi:hypothetical protein
VATRVAVSPVPGDVAAALTELGIDFRVTGDEANALCPNPRHTDRTPSWYCNLDTGMFQCFSCSWSGPFVKLVRALRGGGEDQAALWCQTRSSGRLRPLSAREETPEREVKRITEASLALFVPPPARELKKRMISSDAAADLGILWDEKERSWILPFRDEFGKLHGWQSKHTRGAKLVRNHPRGIRKASFLFRLLGEDADECILVESPLDVARIRSAGPRGGAASYGVRVSGDQLGQIAAHYRTLISALDNDSAGREVSEKLRREFRRLPLKFFDYGNTGAKDPGAMSDEEILRGIENAIPALIARF